MRDIVALHGDGHRDSWAARHLLVETLHVLDRTEQAASRARQLSGPSTISAGTG